MSLGVLAAKCKVSRKPSVTLTPKLLTVLGRSGSRHGCLGLCKRLEQALVTEGNFNLPDRTPSKGVVELEGTPVQQSTVGDHDESEGLACL
jgi:hypothetical protein